MLIEKQFDTGTVVINYVESECPRPPLVMMHGSTLWWKYYLPVLPQLSARWHTYAMDLRGHGKSGRVKDGYAVEDYAADCVALLTQRLSQPAILLGHSLGGLVATQVAAQHPELVRALVLEDPPLYGYRTRPRTEQNDPRFVLFRDLAATGAPVATIADRIGQQQPDRDMAWVRLRARAVSLLDPNTLTMMHDGRMTRSFDIDELLPAVSCPVLLLRADPTEGGAISDAEERSILAATKDISLVRFPGVGHGIAGTQPDRYTRVVSDFLESLD